ncbi:type 1 glutamine amidotransferase domain-containing protein [Telluribacter sp.]|jgi:protease I|uniref:type 1 glutamine amidotransferase domain-containing protein n=1 Tax=Telluribacter sp. TaxID=1978767 RepID=UPI002E0F07F8|nr:type 1 glutamine amidotransferase domain-containing protein [Telluribacter sp.]
MEARLKGIRIAILVADGFEQVELTEPRKALDMCGATTHIISPNKDSVKGWNHIEWGETFKVDVPLEQARPGYYDALLLPGGILNPDSLRMNTRAVEFVRCFFTTQKPVAAICHSLQMLIEAEVVKGRLLTSYPSLRKDLENAGARWVDREVVVDRGLVSSRKPDDIPAFNQKMIKEIAEGVPSKQHA